MPTKSLRPHKRVRSPQGGESKTQQQFAAATNVNTIVKRYTSTGQTGFPVRSSGRKPLFGDFRHKDLHTQLTELKRAQYDFYSLPAGTRAKFGNSPEKMLAFLDDEKNRDAAIKMGLIPAPEVDKPVEVVVKNQEKTEEKEGVQGA